MAAGLHAHPACPRARLGGFGQLNSKAAWAQGGHPSPLFRDDFLLAQGRQHRLSVMQERAAAPNARHNAWEAETSQQRCGRPGWRTASQKRRRGWPARPPCCAAGRPAAAWPAAHVAPAQEDVHISPVLLVDKFASPRRFSVRCWPRRTLCWAAGHKQACRRAIHSLRKGRELVWGGAHIEEVCQGRGALRGGAPRSLAQEQRQQLRPHGPGGQHVALPGRAVARHAALVLRPARHAMHAQRFDSFLCRLECETAAPGGQHVALPGRAVAGHAALVLQASQDSMPRSALGPLAVQARWPACQPEWYARSHTLSCGAPCYAGPMVSTSLTCSGAPPWACTGMWPSAELCMLPSSRPHLRKGRCAWLMLDTMVDALVSWFTRPLPALPSCVINPGSWAAQRHTRFCWVQLAVVRTESPRLQVGPEHQRPAPCAQGAEASASIQLRSLGPTSPAGASCAAGATRQGEPGAALGGGHQGASTASHRCTRGVSGRESGQLCSAWCRNLNRRREIACTQGCSAAHWLPAAPQRHGSCAGGPARPSWTVLLSSSLPTDASRQRTAC